MLLFIDTETTGLPNFDLRARDPSQPHIVQLAMLITDDAGRIMESHSYVVKPDGWEIPKEASDVYGITNEIAANGEDEKFVAAALLAEMKLARLTVAHNLQFDKFVARCAIRRYELITDEQDAWWKALPTFCTMKSSTYLCKIPGKFGFKWPKLSEAYQHFFGKELENAHDALADVRACKEIYFHLTTTNPEK